MPFPLRCPACHSRSVRLVVPTSPEVQSFRCNDCSTAWDMMVPRPDVLPGEGADSVTRSCAICGSTSLEVTERMERATQYRCRQCARTVTVRIIAPGEPS